MARRLPRRLQRVVGLRARILLALVVTAVITLAAAAFALLSPLQHRLRDQSARALLVAGRTVRPQLDSAIRRDEQDSDLDVAGGRPGRRTQDLIGSLALRAGAQVALTGGNGVRPLAAGALPPSDDLDDATEVLAVNHVVQTRRGDQQRIALPLGARPRGTPRNGIGPYYVLLLRRTDAVVSETVDEVRRAFLAAALIGLVVALVLGLLLTTTLTRRLERLRQSALRMVTDGADASPPRDEGADEVGDLARAMARMQAGLRQQERARRRFVATASHELRTPLTSLSGNLELLSEDLERPDLDRGDARAQVEAARGQLARLRSLATELLDLSRLDAGVELRSEPVELGEVARAVAAEFGIQARARGSEVDVTPPRGPCWARGDPDAVARVVRILLDNALRYAPPGTVVHLGAGYNGGDAHITVADDGPGVPDAEREQIFERFQRGTTTGGVGGFGLGLAIGRELAERQGGALELDPVVAGARFSLTLPIELPGGGEG